MGRVQDGGRPDGTASGRVVDRATRPLRRQTAISLVGIRAAASEEPRHGRRRLARRTAGQIQDLTGADTMRRLDGQ